jgi:flagellar hook-basal body protein
MSFYTSLTGLNAATAMLGVTANNISNVGTTGFKRSRADFGDIFATSPLQKSSSTVGQGVSLKQVSQEFSQGNISFSSNALDLAITGDGFFPLRSADGLTDTYTRNGSFSLNEQFNVVNSAGQRLMAATVDSTGSANVNDRVVLTIPQKTSGEAKQTSLVSLGLNFPADAAVINVPFNRTDPASYNKSTAFTVYDNGGNGYLATIYYAKTQNANQSSPFNKWQTYVYVGDDQVSAALAQSTDVSGDLQYVNQYGQIKSYKEVKDELTTAKTQLISLDELTDKRISAPAAVTGVPSQVDLSGGENTFKKIVQNTQLDLSNLFTVKVDGSTQPVTVDLSYLKDSAKVLNGTAVAAEATKFLNRKFGDETTFNFTSASALFSNPDTNLSITNSRIGSEIKVPITLSGFQDPANVAVDEIEQIFQTQVDNSVLGGHARQRLDLSGQVTPQTKSGVLITAATFFKHQLPSEKGQTVGDTAIQTAKKIVDNKVDILVLPEVIRRGIKDITLGADGQSVVLEYNQFPKTFFKVSGTTKSGEEPLRFQDVEIAGSAAGDSAAKTALLIIKNKADILANVTEATSISKKGVTDIQLDPTDPDGTTLMFVYDQSKIGAIPSFAPTIKTKGNTATAEVGTTTLNWIPQATMKVSSGLSADASVVTFMGVPLAKQIDAAGPPKVLTTTTPVGLAAEIVRQKGVLAVAASTGVTAVTGSGLLDSAFAKDNSIVDIALDPLDSTKLVFTYSKANPNGRNSDPSTSLFEYYDAQVIVSGGVVMPEDNKDDTVEITIAKGQEKTDAPINVLGVSIPYVASLTTNPGTTTAIGLAAAIAAKFAGSDAAAMAYKASKHIKDVKVDTVDKTKLIITFDEKTPAIPATTGTTPTVAVDATYYSKEEGLATALALSNKNRVASSAFAKVTNYQPGPGPSDNVINEKFKDGQGTPELLLQDTVGGGGITTGTPLLLNSNLAKSPMKVVYDYNTQSFKITDSTNAGANTITIGAGISRETGQFLAANTILNLTATPKTLNSNGLSGVKMLPNNKNPLRSPTDQRFGMAVTYDAVSKTFSVKSGTTGDLSSIAITDVSNDGLKLMGLKKVEIAKSAVALRGIDSLPAVAVGKPPTVNVTNNFNVDDTNNSFVVTVDGIKGTVRIPPSSTYSLESFMRELQRGINNLASDEPDPYDPNLASPATVNGVKVTFDYTNNRFVFTTGTTGSDSFIKISGDTAWGLDQVEAGRGATSTWIKPSQHYDIVSGAPQAKYIDKDGKETTNGDGFTGLPAWSPIYLDKGELTFNTAGKLYSPIKGTQLETVYLAGGKGALTINVNYAASTQYTSPFAVLSQSQDGAPEGSLVGVTIGNDGLVSASFSNGTQKSLAKILLTNFSSPSGLRQIGDSSFLASAASGKPILGTAGSAGFGTLRAGATERANVDLTQELVDLITAQRNFQANAKAIETSSTMTSAIINLRS